MQRWKTLSRQTILDHSKYLKVESHRIALPNGQVIPDWAWVVTPDYVNIVAITEDGQFLCFRQIKYALGEVSLAIPGGYVEPDEVPLVAAQRELLEESGYIATDWIGLGHYQVDGNRGAGIGYLFLATNAHQVQKPEADDLEEQEMLLLSRAEIEQSLAQGEFKVLSWATSVALALLHTQNG